MPALSGHLTAPRLQTLLTDGALAANGGWIRATPVSS